MSIVRTWQCRCGYNVVWSYDSLALCGNPVCPYCDIDMILLHTRSWSNMAMVMHQELIDSKHWVASPPKPDSVSVMSQKAAESICEYLCAAPPAHNTTIKVISVQLTYRSWRAGVPSFSEELGQKLHEAMAEGYTDIMDIDQTDVDEGEGMVPRVEVHYIMRKPQSVSYTCDVCGSEWQEVG